MRHLNSLIAIILSIAIWFGLGSCNSTPEFIGTWTSTPIDLTVDIPSATAQAVITVTFDKAPDTNQTGNFSISSIISATRSVGVSAMAVAEPYAANVAATANVNGTWALNDDDDEVLMIFDRNSLDINIEPEGVTFVHGEMNDEPLLDSIRQATIEKWSVALRRAVATEVFSWSELDDVDIHNKHIMTFEVGHRVYSFTKK